jgi:hypothetical protein
MKFPVFSLNNREVGFQETSSLVNAPSAHQCLPRRRRAKVEVPPEIIRRILKMIST